MGNYKFSEDLKVAKKTEHEVAELLEKFYCAEIKEFKTNSDYDILAEIKGKEYKFEVKEDFMCVDTGNVALEFECRGKPSGITISDADYYIYKLVMKDGPEYILHSTKELKAMIEKKKYFRIVIGGDKGSNTMNYLFKYNAFLRNGKHVFVEGETTLA